MIGRLLAHADVCLAERGLKCGEDALRFLFVRLEEPPERIERELLDREDRQCARVLAACGR